LQAQGLSVVTTREPGGSVEAENIRALLVTGEPGRWDAISETLLLYAARRDHWLRLIEPALARGDWVLCDRFADSTRVYQGIGKGVDAPLIEELHRLALVDVEPDLTLLLDLPAEMGLARSRAREDAAVTGETRFERMTLDFHQSLRAGFLALAARHPDRFATIDATHGVAEVAAAVLDAVRVRFSLDDAG
jgi:dTMP kinase